MMLILGFLLLAIFGVLMTGVIGMVRGGDFNKKYGNKLMRLRVGLQFLAVLVILAMFLLSQN